MHHYLTVKFVLMVRGKVIVRVAIVAIVLLLLLENCSIISCNRRGNMVDISKRQISTT